MIISCEPYGGTGLLNEITCMYCGGDGEVDLLDEEFRHMMAGPRRALWGVVSSSILSKLDSIIAEQASQCEDLTAALSQIWNKVKDL